MKLGITGNIASGKSVVQSFFEQQGIPSIDADRIVHDILDNDKKIIYEISKIFNENIIDDKGKINRNKLGEVVFRDKNKLKILEDILHPLVKCKIDNFFKKNVNEKITAAFIPLLFEANMENLFDKIVFIGVDKEIQVKRLMKRNDFSEEQALLRINAQLSQKSKIQKSDFVIWNNGTIQELQTQIEILLNQLKNQ